MRDRDAGEAELGRYLDLDLAGAAHVGQHRLQVLPRARQQTELDLRQTQVQAQVGRGRGESIALAVFEPFFEMGQCRRPLARRAVQVADVVELGGDAALVAQFALDDERVEVELERTFVVAQRLLRNRQVRQRQGDAEAVAVLLAE